MRFRRSVIGIVVLAILALAATAGWLLMPWRRIDGLRVEAAQVVAVRDGAGAPRRIVVVFGTGDNLNDVLARYGAGFVTARLLRCDDDTRDTRMVVVQRDGYLVDEGRVRPLSGSAGRARYRAEFDDRLSGIVDHRVVSMPASGVPLCFTLEGGGMFMGRIRADTIPLDPFLHPPS